MNQICAIWQYACDKQPKFYQPDEHGWMLENNSYTIKWFLGPQCPQNLDEICDSGEEKSVDESEVYNESSDKGDL